MLNKKGSNAYSIKQNNRALILNIIKHNDRVSRVDLSKLTGLSKGGITPIINELINLRLIRESGISDTKSGRKPITLEINPSGCHAVAVDFSRKRFSVSLINLKGEISDIRIYDYLASDNLDNILKQLKFSVMNLIKGNTGKRIIGIGIAAPGPLDYIHGIILSPPNFFGWSNIPIKSIMEEWFGIPTFLDNNANAHGLSEKYYGAGRAYHNFIHVVVDEGIGASIILNDKIYRGRGGLGSEIGHMLINIEGPRCECGNNGCLEMYADIPVLLKDINTALNLGASSDYLESIKLTRSLQWEDIVYGLSIKDPLCLNIMQREAKYLGSALISLINILEPEAIILGGAITKAGCNILVPVKNFIKERTMTRNTQIPDILLSDLSQASLIGGATIVFEQFISGKMGEYENVLNSTV